VPQQSRFSPSGDPGRRWRTLIYLVTAPQPASPNTAATKSPSSGESGFNIGVDISGAFSAVHDVFVKTETVTSTTTDQITSEKTTTTTVVSRTTQVSTLTQTSVSTVTSIASVTLTHNVTLLFINMDGNFTYDIEAGSSSISGVRAWEFSFFSSADGPLSGTDDHNNRGDHRAGGCRTGEQFTMQLWSTVR